VESGENSCGSAFPSLFFSLSPILALHFNLW